MVDSPRSPGNPTDAPDRSGDLGTRAGDSSTGDGSPAESEGPPGPRLSMQRRRGSRAGGRAHGPAIGRLAWRYGPYGVVVALGVAAFFVFGGGDGGNEDRGDDDRGDNEVSSDATSEREELILSGPMTPERAEVEGVDPDFGPNCDTTTGRIELPTVYAPPCVVPFEGDNGGATSMGVTEDTIKVVAYLTDPQVDPLASATAGVANQDLDPTRQAETIQAFVDLYNARYETYGRKVEVEAFTGTGAMDDAAAARADAIAIAEKEPFAVVGGPLQASPAFSDELAARGVLCVSSPCATGLTDEFAEERAPYVMIGGNSADAAEMQAEVVAKLAGPGKAEMAGDPSLREQERVYGMVRFNDPDGTQQEVFEQTRDLLAERGVELETDIEYFLDLARVQENARTVISQLKAAGVTTVVFSGDPVTPGSLTQEATAQEYHPEWIAGFGFAVDSPRFARGYDPDQWTNGFGVTFNAPTPPQLEPSTQLYEWAYGSEPPSGNFAGQLEAPLRMLFIGIHLAGPELSAESFDDGLARYPASGGRPAMPLYQPHNDTSFDVALIWWDPEAEGLDPDGTENVGFYRFANGGQRYGLGEIPDSPGEAGLFDVESSVVQYDDVPREDRAPDYAPPEL